MKVPSLFVKKLCVRLCFFKSRSKLKVKFRDHGCKGIAVMCRKPFPKSMHYDLDL